MEREKSNMNCGHYKRRKLIFATCVGCILTLLLISSTQITHRTLFLSSSINPQYIYIYNKDGGTDIYQNKSELPVQRKVTLTNDLKNNSRSSALKDSNRQTANENKETQEHIGYSIYEENSVYSKEPGNSGYQYQAISEYATTQKSVAYSQFQEESSTVQRTREYSTNLSDNTIPLTDLVGGDFPYFESKSANLNFVEAQPNKPETYSKDSNIHVFAHREYDRIINMSQSLLLNSPICETKKNHIAFLKVHKAGSTTTMNIFLRYAITNALNIVLPKRWAGTGFNYLGYGKTLSRKNIVPLPLNQSYDILCNHVIYNRSAFANIMPSDSVYIGIIRDPSTHFVSASVYYGFYRSIKKIVDKQNKIMGNSSPVKILSEFLKNPQLYKNVSTMYVHSRMSYDFGIAPKYFYNKTYIDSYLKKLENEFELVMIMEYFYESLILMRRLLCWEIKDILYIPLNVRTTQNDKTKQSTEDIRRLSIWNYADFKLYERFNKTFWEKVENEGTEFYDEVKYFKDLQLNVTLFCQYLKQDSFIYVEQSRWNNPFTVSYEECMFMRQKELPLMKQLIISAWKKYNEWLLHTLSDVFTHDKDRQNNGDFNLRNSPYIQSNR